MEKERYLYKGEIRRKKGGDLKVRFAEWSSGSDNKFFDLIL